MQKDFHFYITYGLCRCWGYDSIESQTIATASQFTDDCVSFRPLPRADGEPYQIIETQCQPQRALTPKAQRDILMPFHFRAEPNDGNVVTAGNSAASALLIASLELQGKNKAPSWLHALGIALHVYVDTFSHQGFSAFRSVQNAVKDLNLVSGDEDLMRLITGGFGEKYRRIPPRIGHAEAFGCPDIPYLKWIYSNDGNIAWIGKPKDGVTVNKEFIQRDNACIAHAAVRESDLLIRRHSGRKSNCKSAALKDFFSSDAFRGMDTYDHRESEWYNKILNSKSDGKLFGFLNSDESKYFSYLGNVWTVEAYGLKMVGGRAKYGLYEKYQESEWWKFQKAAEWVRDFSV